MSGTRSSVSFVLENCSGMVWRVAPIGPVPPSPVDAALFDAEKAARASAGDEICGGEALLLGTLGSKPRLILPVARSKPGSVEETASAANAALASKTKPAPVASVTARPAWLW